MPYNVGIIFRDGGRCTYDSGDYPACQARRSKAGLRPFPQRREAARQPAATSASDFATRGSDGLGPYESATVRVATNGRSSSTPAHAARPGAQDDARQIAADQLGSRSIRSKWSPGHGDGRARYRDIRRAHGRERGLSVHVAAVEVARKAKKLAAGMMECVEEDLELAAVTCG
jgi:hypothetical protein